MGYIEGIREDLPQDAAYRAVVIREYKTNGQFAGAFSALCIIIMILIFVFSAPIEVDDNRDKRTAYAADLVNKGTTIQTATARAYKTYPVRITHYPNPIAIIVGIVGLGSMAFAIREYYIYSKLR